MMDIAFETRFLETKEQFKIAQNPKVFKKDNFNLVLPVVRRIFNLEQNFFENLSIVQLCVQFYVHLCVYFNKSD